MAKTWYYIYDTENREYVNIIFKSARAAREYLAGLYGCDTVAEYDAYTGQYGTPHRIEKSNKLYF